jgi:hypothetical protein
VVWGDGRCAGPRKLPMARQWDPETGTQAQLWWSGAY